MQGMLERGVGWMLMYHPSAARPDAILEAVPAVHLAAAVFGEEWPSPSCYALAVAAAVETGGAMFAAPLERMAAWGFGEVREAAAVLESL
jgi:hypothetical protein